MGRPERALLLGSGWSIPFGGYSVRDLSDRVRGELWTMPELRDQFNEGGGDLTGITYEEVLGRWQHSPLMESDKYLELTKAIRKVLSGMDKDMAVFRTVNDQPASIFGYQKLLTEFMEGGLVFTLNHDSWFERFLTDQRGKSLNIVGLSQEDQIDNTQSDWHGGPWIQPPENVEPVVSRCTIDEKALNVMKLHGGLNWVGDNGALMIMGTNKETMIKDDPVFSELHTLQDTYLGSAKKIMIFGYGFRDKHINETLLKAASVDAEFYVFDVKTYREWLDHIRMKWSEPSEFSTDFPRRLRHYCSLGHRVFSDVNHGGLDSRIQEFLA